MVQSKGYIIRVYKFVYKTKIDHISQTAIKTYLINRKDDNCIKLKHNHCTKILNTSLL